MPATQNRNEAAFSLGDLVPIFRRRIQWFLIPTGAGLLIAFAIAVGLPPVYEAETTILIEPATIREDFVRSTVVSDKESRFEQSRLRLRARDSLASIIEEYDLYSDSAQPMEARVEAMREDVVIEPILPQIIDPRRPVEIESVRIAYDHSDPNTAAEVANSLAREFIRINIEARARDAQGTSDFINAELVREEEELLRVLKEISDFKEKHLHELPSKLAQNQSTLEQLRRQLGDRRIEFDQARSQIALIQAQLAEMRATTAGGDSPAQRKLQTEQAISSLRSQGFTDKHPDIQMFQAQLAELERQIAAEGQAPPVRSDAEMRLVTELRRYTTQHEVAALSVERLREDIATYEARIGNTPKRQGELSKLEAKGKSHNEAIAAFRAKKALADAAKSLEAKQQGEKYRVIETAEPPEEPARPNRPLVFVIGSIAGVMIGLMMLVIRELTDARVYTLGQLHEVLPLPVLAAVPTIRLPSEIAATRARLRRWGLSSAAALLIVALGGAIWYFVAAQSSPTPGSPPTAEGARAGDV